MFRSILRPELSSVAIALACLSACQSKDDKDPPPIGETSGDASTTADSTDSGTGTGPDMGSEMTCADLDCGLHGVCETTMDGPQCTCEAGYAAALGKACEPDEGCISLRYLEEECRQLVNDAPGVGLVFTIDLCSGDPVPAEDLAQMGYDLTFAENDTPFTDKPDAQITTLDRPAESFVTLVLNVSDSVTAGDDGAALIDELKGLVAGLEPAQGEGDVYVQVYVFGRNVARYVDPTSDLAAVQTALQAIADDPAPAQALVNGNGSSTYHAVERAIHGTTRARQLRAAVTNGGVLSVGSVIVVTDQDDGSGATLDQALISSTLERIMIVGVGDGITDPELQAIGRDGVYSAPVADTWPDVFDELTGRVDAYPRAVYMRAYCSGSIQGTPTVEISLDGVAPTKTATCGFDANLFASMPPACNADLFNADCDAKSCGGFSACGACSDSECCTGTTCAGPASATDCQDQDELCNPSDEICVPDGNSAHECVAPPAVGDGCVDVGGSFVCDPGASWCQLDDQDPDYLKCVASLANGAACNTADQCASLHCDQTNPNNPNDPRICLAPAEIFDACAPADATCEHGSYCSAECTRRGNPGDACSSDEHCLSGNCAGSSCVDTGMCHWAWDEVAG